MTTTSQTATHEKTRGKAGLVSVLGDHQPATEQTLQGDVLLKKFSAHDKKIIPTRFS